MKRIHLFEFEDFAWFPRWLREGLTNYLAAMHELLRTDKLIAPLVMRALKTAKQAAIVDLCSGGGGPMLAVARELRTTLPHLKLTLTDLFPNREAVAAINGMNDAHTRYESAAVDAGDVGRSHEGVRTMICSLHHMRPPVARRILSDALQKRQPLCVFEVSDNAAPIWLWWLTIPVGILTTLVCTPLVRPLTAKQLFFTYIIPIFPLLIAWDGAISNMRTYTPDDMRELLDGLDSPDYDWEVGRLTKPRYPGTMLYLLGLPKKVSPH